MKHSIIKKINQAAAGHSQCKTIEIFLNDGNGALTKALRDSDRAVIGMTYNDSGKWIDGKYEILEGTAEGEFGGGRPCVVIRIII